MSTYLDLLPADLDITTTERLLLVADIITLDPRHWDQTYFIANYDDHGEFIGTLIPSQVVAQPQVIKCGTRLCLAGWSVVTSPESVVSEILADDGITQDTKWWRAGAVAFGLDWTLGHDLFYNFDLHASQAAWILRELAKLPEPRTYEAARAAGIVLDHRNFAEPPEES